MNDLTTTQEQELLDKATEILNMLAEGKFLEAMKKHMAEHVSLYEGNNPAKVGLDFCLAEEEALLDTVVEFGGYKVLSGPAVKGDTTFYEAVMEFKTNDGQSHRFEQVVRTKWENGKIVDERYYHA